MERAASGGEYLTPRGVLSSIGKNSVVQVSTQLYRGLLSSTGEYSVVQVSSQFRRRWGGDSAAGLNLGAEGGQGREASEWHFYTLWHLLLQLCF